MNELTRKGDPWTSQAAPSDKTTRDTIRKAVYRIFEKYGRLTDEELVNIYLSKDNFPKATAQGIRSRRAELVREGLIEEEGSLGVTVSGRRCLYWKKAK